MGTVSPTKLQLLDHINEWHAHKPAKADLSLFDLQRWHAERHHTRQVWSHGHAGEPGARPPGWKTGADVVPMD